jgi:hypothetical protein
LTDKINEWPWALNDVWCGEFWQIKATGLITKEYSPWVFVVERNEDKTWVFKEDAWSVRHGISSVWYDIFDTEELFKKYTKVTDPKNYNPLEFKPCPDCGRQTFYAGKCWYE